MQSTMRRFLSEKIQSIISQNKRKAKCHAEGEQWWVEKDQKARRKAKGEEWWAEKQHDVIRKAKEGQEANSEAEEEQEAEDQVRTAIRAADIEVPDGASHLEKQFAEEQ